jgi:hypothetical protein
VDVQAKVCQTFGVYQLCNEKRHGPEGCAEHLNPTVAEGFFALTKVLVI